MKNEFSVNNFFALQSDKNMLVNKIKKHVGIVPASWYDELDQIEIQLLKVA